MDHIKDQELAKSLEVALRNIFGEGGTEQQKFVNVSRIPLICQDIKGIHKAVGDLNQKIDTKVVSKSEFWPVKALVYGAASIILTGVFVALIAMVITR